MAGGEGGGNSRTVIRVHRLRTQPVSPWSGSKRPHFMLTGGCIFRCFVQMAGHKSDFNGHSKLSWGNINVYPSVYGTKCIGIFGQ